MPRFSRRSLPSTFVILLSALLIGAFILRVLYLIKTPYSLRAHDFEAHVDYVRHIAAYWWFPRSEEGWEFYQQPLYYVIMGFWWNISTLVGHAHEWMITHLRWFSLFFSFALVPLAIPISRYLFSRREQSAESPRTWLHLTHAQWDRFFFCAIIAVFPALIYTTSRISNDLLFQVLSFLSCLLLLRWEQRRDLFTWYVLCIVLGLNIFTKLNGLLFVAVAFLCLLRVEWKHPRRLLTRGLLSLLIIGLIGGWFPAMRVMQGQTRATIPGAEGLDAGVLLPNNPENLLTFNPIAFVSTPFIDPWLDETRRQYFPEYFFRSAFFGEWDFGEDLRPLASLLLVVGLGVLVLMLWGLWISVRRKTPYWFPMLSMLVIFLLGSIAFRYSNTCSCSQDFRYATPLVIPIVYYAALGAGSFRSWRRWLGRGLLAFFIILCAAFIVLIPG